MPSFLYSVKFSAPLFNELPVTADLEGKAAQGSAQKASKDMERSLKGIKRVVVRGSTAVMIFSKNEWSNFAQEDGQWKSDD